MASKKILCYLFQYLHQKGKNYGTKTLYTMYLRLLV